MLVITAEKLREMSSGINAEGSVSVELQMQINEKALWCLQNRERSFTLDFTLVGYNYSDVQWLEELGYTLNRNSPCLWWEVSW